MSGAEEQVQRLTEALHERIRWIDALEAEVGELCRKLVLSESIRGQVTELRGELAGHRLALSEALGLGTGAPWEAIHERACELAASERTRGNTR